jgi:hypothetical protein
MSAIHRSCGRSVASSLLSFRQFAIFATFGSRDEEPGCANDRANQQNDAKQTEGNGVSGKKVLEELLDGLGTHWLSLLRQIDHGLFSNGT